MKKCLGLLIIISIILFVSCNGGSPDVEKIGPPDIEVVKKAKFDKCPGKTIEELINERLDDVHWKVSGKEGDYWIEVSGLQKGYNSLDVGFAFGVGKNNEVKLQAMSVDGGFTNDEMKLNKLIETMCKSNAKLKAPRSDRQNYLYTMGEMKSLGTAVVGYITDNNIAPAELSDEGFGGTKTRSFYYRKELPPTDEWGNKWYYYRDLNNKDVFFIGSSGKDGIWKGFEQKGTYSNFSGDDIIYSNGTFASGGFVYGPKGGMEGLYGD